MQHFMNLLLTSLFLSLIGCGQNEGRCPESIAPLVDEPNAANTDTPNTAQENDSDQSATTEDESSEPEPDQSEDEIDTEDDGLCDGPQAIGRIANCEDSASDNCNAIETQPLTRVYLDGSQSYDPAGGTIVGYQWEVVELPAHADPGAFDWSGTSSTAPSLFIPSPGNYRACLTVYNDSGLMHCNNVGNCVDILAE